MSKRRRFGLAVTAVLVTALAAGCTSSSSPAKTQAPPSSQVPTSVSSPTPTPTVSPTPTPAPTKAPLSAFEADPAVQTIRAWTAAGGRAVNAGKYTSAALQHIETAYLAGQSKLIFGPDVGGYYPGPLPYQPVGVTVTNSTHRIVHGCVENSGWVQNPKTKRPLHPVQITPTDFQAVEQSGRWLLAAFYLDKKVSCAHVKVATPSW